MWKALIIAAILSWPCPGHAELVPDTTFGNNGTVDIPLGGTQYTNPARIAVLPDRRIVVARLDTRPGEAPIMPSLSLARLLPDGRPDPAFCSGGIATFAVTGTAVLRAFAPTLAVQPDGSAFALVPLVTIDPDSSFAQTELVVLHIAADGRADPAFNGGQPVRFRADLYSRFKPFVQPGGVLIAGFGNGPSTVGAWRIRADGTPDPAFGTAGSLEITASTWMSDVMPVPGGGFQILHRPMDGTSAFWRRHRADGTLDTAFGNGGDSAIPSFGGRGIAYVHALGDGTFLGAEKPSCGRYVLDAEGRVQSTFNGTCDPAHDSASLNARAEAWRGGILMSGLQAAMSITSPSDGTYLWLLDRQGRPDAEFVAPQSLRWRPPPGIVGSYAVAADGNLGVVVALADNGYVPDAVRVQRYADVRRGTAIQPVPALGLPAMLLMLAGAAMLARRRLARR